MHVWPWKLHFGCSLGIGKLSKFGIIASGSRITNSNSAQICPKDVRVITVTYVYYVSFRTRKHRVKNVSCHQKFPMCPEGDARRWQLFLAWHSATMRRHLVSLYDRDLSRVTQERPWNNPFGIQKFLVRAAGGAFVSGIFPLRILCIDWRVIL